jgi:hypothetical protein
MHCARAVPSTAHAEKTSRRSKAYTAEAIISPVAKHNAATETAELGFGSGGSCAALKLFRPWFRRSDQPLDALKRLLWEAEKPLPRSRETEPRYPCWRTPVTSPPQQYPR